MITLLVTGFGAFPGTRHNPSAALIAALQTRRAYFERRGIRLELRILPVLYENLEQRLAKFVVEANPDAILHFGLAARRNDVTVETRARNRVNSLHKDAAGRLPADAIHVDPKGPAIARASIPSGQIIAPMRRAGIKARLSQDAGTYLCNAALYASLTAPHPLPAGFIHIPKPRRRAPSSGLRPSFPMLVKAAEIALLVVASTVRAQAMRRAPGAQESPVNEH